MAADSGVSIVICTWNRASSLDTTLRSLAEQQVSCAEDVEVIVVDNNSADSTRQIVQQRARQWPLGCLVYEFEPRQGKQFALNRGIARATHAVIAFTDDDILFPPQWLRSIQRLFADPQVDLAGGRTLIGWPREGPPSWYADELQAVLGGVDLGATMLNPAPAGYAPAGGNMAVRRPLFERCGGFSELHFRHMDHEFGIRCQRLGARVVYDPALEVLAPVDIACLSKRYFRRWAFKAGIAQNDGKGLAERSFPRLPGWMYRQLVGDALVVVFPLATPATRFAREFRFWRMWGTMANAWRVWLRPGSHERWIAKYSQKKGGRFY